MNDAILNLFAGIHIVLVWAIVIVGTLGFALLIADRTVCFFLRRTEAWIAFIDFVVHRKAFKAWMDERKN